MTAWSAPGPMIPVRCDPEGRLYCPCVFHIGTDELMVETDTAGIFECPDAKPHRVLLERALVSAIDRLLGELGA